MTSNSIKYINIIDLSPATASYYLESKNNVYIQYVINYLIATDSLLRGKIAERNGIIAKT